MADLADAPIAISGHRLATNAGVERAGSIIVLGRSVENGRRYVV
jgi:hypothetical protein